jgi:hypothetical protein
VTINLMRSLRSCKSRAGRQLPDGFLLLTLLAITLATAPPMVKKWGWVLGIVGGLVATLVTCVAMGLLCYLFVWIAEFWQRSRRARRDRKEE